MNPFCIQNNLIIGMVGKNLFALILKSSYYFYLLGSYWE